MQKRNLGFTCYRLDPETYKTLTEICKTRNVESHEAIALAFKIATTLTRGKKFLTEEGQEEIRRLLKPHT